MPASTIFARIKPASIKVSEEYHYEVNPWQQIPVRPKQSDEKNRQGQIEIIVPYDGEKTLTEEVRKAIARQDRGFWKRDSADVCIGYLGFSNHQRTDLGTVLRLGVEHDTIALQLPLGKNTVAPDDRLLDRRACKYTHDYRPAVTGEPPLELSLQLFDEISLEDLPITCWNLLEPGHSETEPEPVELPAHLTAVMQRHDSFERSLLFEFTVTLKMPRPPAGVGKAPPTLESLSLKWPAPFAIQRAQATVIAPNGQPKGGSIHYNSETGEIVCRQPPLILAPQKNGNDKTVVYQSARLRLEIQHPGEMFGAGTLRGVAQLKLPGVLSGVEVHLFDATGQRSDCAVAYETRLRLDFELDPAEYVSIKNHTPYQYFQFDGVLIDEGRIADIKTVLYDLGFAVRSTQVPHFGQQHVQHFVIAHQRQGAEEMWLLILVQGRIDQTQRSRGLRGDHLYVSWIDSGHLTVRIRGKLTGEHRTLVQRINEVQARLKHLFQYVSMAQ